MAHAEGDGVAEGVPEESEEGEGAALPVPEGVPVAQAEAVALCVEHTVTDTVPVCVAERAPVAA